jgi:uncharacterized protein YqgV (UPF0045/DUF77 family)
MRTIGAQVSIYGLGGTDTSAVVTAFLEALKDRELAFEVGAMSTVVWGDEAEVWSALREGYAAATRLGAAVMQVTFSNACPLPGGEEGGDG